MSGEITRKLDTRKTVSSNEKSNYVLTRISDNLLKLEHHAGLKKLSRCVTRTRHSRYSFALIVLTKKSELYLNDKDVFPQVCIDAF